MTQSYAQTISELLLATQLEIDLDIQVSGQPPSMASSEFLTNREQGDWAEAIVIKSINSGNPDYVAFKYGRSENLAAGDPGFEEFYREYQNELNTLGKKPDILVFRKEDVGNTVPDLTDQTTISKAVAAIEVRSSSFLSATYAEFMANRTMDAVKRCKALQAEILQPAMRALLLSKDPKVLELIENADEDSFRDLSFRQRSWTTTPDLTKLSGLLRDLKDQVKIIQRRDYLSITPKIEDLALVHRWIKNFNVKHFYLQVFFDKAYVVPFKKILEYIADPTQEGVSFSIEKDSKNQGKSTIKLDIRCGKEVIRGIDMPTHVSEVKYLARGRLLFYVTFKDGGGCLDQKSFNSEVINGC